MKIKISIISGLLLGLFLFSGCEDYLDVVPVNDITTIETEFEKREDADKWLQTCYVFLTYNSAEAQGDPAMFGADEFCGGDYARKNETSYVPALFIGDGLQMANNPYCNVWHKNQYFAALRYCNIFIDNIDKVYNMSDSEKKIWKAEVKAVKAYYYFDMMRRYGPIILVNQNIPANATIDEMQQPRRPIDEVVDTIVSICDDAMKDLPLRANSTQDRWYYFSKEGAATIKAMTLLYAASPLFNGASAFQNFTNKNGEKLFPAYDKEKWHRAALAIDEAIQICNEGGLKLIAGNVDRPTKMLNTMKDIEQTWDGLGYNNPEAIMMVKDQAEMLDKLTMIYSSSDFYDYYDDNSRGCLTAPISMVEMFYTEHGLPINEDRQWMVNKYQMSRETDERYRDVVPLNTEILSLHRRREPRFYADIAADRTFWYRKTSSSGSMASYGALLMQNRYNEACGTTSSRLDESMPQGLTGYWIKKQLNPEVAIPYYNRQVSGEQQPKIIWRLPDLYLASAEAWNEYLDAPDAHVYEMIDKVRERAGIPKVRDAWKSYAKNPDKVNTQAGMRSIIQQEWNIEFAFEGRRFWNLRRWMTAPNELNSPQKGWNVLAADEAGFYCNYQGPKVIWSKRKFVAPRDYFFPIRAEEVLISGVNQNLGWGE